MNLVRPTPMAAPPSDPAFDLLIDGLLARLQSGEAVSWSAVAREHPEHAERLRSMVPALEAIGDLSKAGDSAACGIAPTPDSDGLIPGVLGDFRIFREVGRGGMGVVYEAEQVSLGRRVALKVLPFAATMDPKQLQRFKNEAKAAASLKHEHIVPIYAVGCERGVHYYAMEFVEGQSLAQLIPTLHAPPAPASPAPVASDVTGPYQPDAAPTAPVAALCTERSGPKGRHFYRALAGLVAQAADALEHAHALGLAHRDVKPANLLVDGAGKLYVSDFGLARFGPDAGLTASGDLLGTLRYMAPEQVLARHGLVDHRADVYALGATLYELLTGRPAVDAAERADILRQIAFEEPTPPRKLDKSIPTELEIIAMKCLAKNPNERYATAGELADDVKRFREDQPIRARRVGPVERARRWGRRHPALAAVYGLLALVLTLATAGGAAVWQWQVAEAARGQAVAALQGEKKAQAGEDDAKRKLESALALHRVNLAHRAWTEGDMIQARFLLGRCPQELRNWEWQFVNKLSQEASLVLPEKPGSSLTFSPDGRRLAGMIPTPGEASQAGTRTPTSTVWILDLATRREVLTLKVPGSVGFVAFSPDGKWVAAVGGVGGPGTGRGFARGGRRRGVPENVSGEIRVWDAATGQQVHSLKEPSAGLLWIAFSPDGKRLASQVANNYDIRVWDLASEQVVFTLKGHTFSCYQRGVVFSPDGRFLTTSAWRSPDGQALTPGVRPPPLTKDEVKVWDLATGRESQSFTLGEEPGEGCRLAISPDGKLLASVDREDHTIRIWDLATRKETLALKGHTNGMVHLTFSPDGKRLASGSSDQTVRVWDLADGWEIHHFKGDTGAISKVTFSPDGQSLASRAGDGSVRVWDLTQPPAVRILKGPEAFIRYEGSDPGGRRLAFVVRDGISVWDMATEQEVHRVKGDVYSVAISPDGKRLAGRSTDQAGAASVGVWDLATGQRTLSLKDADYGGNVVFHPDGRHLLSAGESAAIRVWDVITGEPVRELRGHTDAVYRVAFSPDGKRVVSSSRTTVKVWDWASGQALDLLQGHVPGARYLAFTPNGRYLAIASVDKSIKVWELATGGEVTTLPDHTGGVRWLAFSPDGTRLASASNRDETVKVWDWATGEEALSLKGGGDGVAFSPDGQRLISGQRVRVPVPSSTVRAYRFGRQVIVWDATPVPAWRAPGAAPAPRP